MYTIFKLLYLNNNIDKLNILLGMEDYELKILYKEFQYQEYLSINTLSEYYLFYELLENISDKDLLIYILIHTDINFTNAPNKTYLSNNMYFYLFNKFSLPVKYLIESGKIDTGNYSHYDIKRLLTYKYLSFENNQYILSILKKLYITISPNNTFIDCNYNLLIRVEELINSGKNIEMDISMLSKNQLSYIFSEHQMNNTQIKLMPYIDIKIFYTKVIQWEKSGKMILKNKLNQNNEQLIHSFIDFYKDLNENQYIISNKFPLFVCDKKPNMEILFN